METTQNGKRSSKCNDAMGPTRGVAKGVPSQKSIIEKYKNPNLDIEGINSVFRKKSSVKGNFPKVFTKN
jgi:hypothetical protein